jgi:tetratricopeptide (TPR) repeat protein
MRDELSGAVDYPVLILRFTSSQQWDRVLDSAREWLAQDPQNTDAHQAAGHALINLDRYPEAEPHLAHVLAHRPRHTVAHRWLSIVQFHQQKLKAAHDSIHTALSLAPQDPHNWYHLAWLFYKQGDTESARQYAMKSRELAPHDANTINLLALCTPSTAENSGQLFEQYRDALALDPENPMVHNNIGVYHLNAGRDYAAAEESFRRALFFDPTIQVARRNLFLVLKRRDKVYRILTAPKDFILPFFRLLHSRRTPIRVVLFILTLPIWLVLFRFLWGCLILWGILVWPMVKVYEFLIIGDIRAQAGELGARRGGFLGYRHWPLHARLGLFALLLLLFWSTLALAWHFRDRLSLGPNNDNLSGALVLLALVIVIVIYFRTTFKKRWIKFCARRRAKKFAPLLDQPDDRQN